MSYEDGTVHWMYNYKGFTQTRFFSLNFKLQRSETSKKDSVFHNNNRTYFLLKARITHN